MGIVCRQQQLVKYFGTFKGIAVSLRKAIELSHVSGGLLNTQIKRQFTCGSLSLWKGRRNIIIAIEPCHFLCQIRSTENVMTEGWGYDLVCLFIISQFYSV